jgi:hypothetical protein
MAISRLLKPERDRLPGHYAPKHQCLKLVQHALALPRRLKRLDEPIESGVADIAEEALKKESPKCMR